MIDTSEDTKEQAIYRHKKRKYDVARNAYLLRVYGVSLKDYMKILAFQNYACAICKSPKSGHKKSRYNVFCVDHCHKTGEVRGLLCRNCNLVVVPAIEHNAHLVEEAKKYLFEVSCVNILSSTYK